VEVKGLTTREGEQKIEDLYRANKFIRQPHVSVFVKEHVSGKITLMGAVKKPGTVDCFSRRRLLDVLALAEGLSEKAGRSVQVRRAGEDPAYPSTFMIDLDDMLKRGQTELNIPIKGGDVIYVPEAGMVYVDGAVRKAGNYPITQSMSVQQAIVTQALRSPTTAKSLVRSDLRKREIIDLP
jgi:polysaccharide export outer membrane protein